MFIVCLAGPRLFVNNHDGWTFGFVIEAALPVLLRSALPVAEVPEVVVHQQVLTGTLGRLVVDFLREVFNIGAGFYQGLRLDGFHLNDEFMVVLVPLCGRKNKSYVSLRSCECA